MRTAVTYSRVSTGNQAENGQSLDQQAESLRLFCQLKDLRISRHFAEPAKSARRADNRPELAKALDLTCKTKGVLVVHKLDRLVRSAADCERICEQLTAAGADLASVTESIDTTTAIGKAFLGITAVFARLESDKIGERIRAANRHTIATLGYRTQGAQPAGFTVINGRRVEQLDEMEIVYDIKLLAADGCSDYDIAATLNSEDVPTISQMRKYKNSAKHGWSAAAVGKILAASTCAEGPA